MFSIYLTILFNVNKKANINHHIMSKNNLIYIKSKYTLFLNSHSLKLIESICTILRLCFFI